MSGSRGQWGGGVQPPQTSRDLATAAYLEWRIWRRLTALWRRRRPT